MGLFSKIIKDAVGEGIGNAVGKAVEKAVAPAAEKLANLSAEHLNSAAGAIEKNDREIKESSGNLNGAFANLEKAAENYANAAASAYWSNALGAFPMWTLSPIKDTSDEDTAEYLRISISIDATEDMLEKYIELLKINGFSGDCQIQRKTLNGTEYVVDFTFALDVGEINYYIMK